MEQHYVRNTILSSSVAGVMQHQSKNMNGPVKGVVSTCVQGLVWRLCKSAAHVLKMKLRSVEVPIRAPLHKVYLKKKPEKKRANS
jgi:hypothetical protein